MFNFAITPLGNLFFGLTIIAFFSLIFIKQKRENYLLYVILFSSLGVIFYANDLITLFIGWEIMSWSSYFIISQDATLKTAQKYIIFNLGGGFALLGAIVLIYSFTGTFIYDDIIFNKIPVELRKPIYILLFITISIKSGLIPFHYWVVDTYQEADNLFSAILSAIISKSGIFLFIIIFTKIVGYKYLYSNIFDIVAWLGVITSIVATVKAISQDDIKRLLAYSSIAQIGYIVTILSVVHGNSIEAGLYHTIIHTFVKLLLFINIASIIYITGKSRFSELGGLLYRYPMLFILLLIGIIGLAGVPPLGGFNSKFLIYTTLLEQKKVFLLVAIMFSSVLAFLYCFKLIYGIYLGDEVNRSEHKSLPKGYYIPQILSALILVILGALPALGTKTLNPILISLDFKPTSYSSLFELNSHFASLNGGVVMGVFIVIFILILTIALLVSNRTIKVRDKRDISYCGEVPQTNLHYGYGLGRELKRIEFIRVILDNSVSPYWNRVALITKDSSSILITLYNLTVQNIGLLIVLFFTILLFIGVR